MVIFFEKIQVLANYFEKQKNILPNGKNWPLKEMLGDVSIYSVYKKT
jgi:hypothetical protein